MGCFKFANLENFLSIAVQRYLPQSPSNVKVGPDRISNMQTQVHSHLILDTLCTCLIVSVNPSLTHIHSYPHCGSWHRHKYKLRYPGSPHSDMIDYKLKLSERGNRDYSGLRSYLTEHKSIISYTITTLQSDCMKFIVSTAS